MTIEVNKPKFAKNASEEAVFKSIRNEVHQYLSSGIRTNGYLIIKAVFYVLLFICGYVGILFSDTFFILVVWYTVLGFASVFLGLNFAHDFSHNAIFKSRKLNANLFEGLFMLMGISGYLWKKRHVHSHHNYPNTEGYDVDIELGSIVHLSKEKMPKKYHKWQYIYAPVLYGIYTLYWVFYKDFVLFHQKKHANLNFKRHATKEVVKFWVFKLIYIFYALLIPIFFSSLPLMQILLAFLIFHLVISWFLLFTFLITHHVEKTEYFEADEGNLSSSSWLMHQVKSSNDFHPFSKTANFIFGGFNCHIAHHLFPNISHVHYNAISKIIYKSLIKNEILPNKTSFFGGIISHIKLLRKLGSSTAIAA